MKGFQIFIKTPKHRKFSYTPRFYNPEEEERKEREERIRLELEGGKSERQRPMEDVSAYRSRIAGSFRDAKKTVDVQKDPSATMLRLIILLILTIGIIAVLQFGSIIPLYFVALAFIPLYLYLKFRNLRKR